MKLVQIKEFSAETISVQMAAEIAALTCWNHLNEKDYVDRHTVENAEPKGVLKKGGGGRHPWVDDKHAHLYDKTATGVIIHTPVNSRVRVFEDGEINAYYSREKGESEYETITRHIPSGKETQYLKPCYPNRRIELMQLYLDNGFYTVQTT